jgi:hypothetical protein
MRKILPAVFRRGDFFLVKLFLLIPRPASVTLFVQADLTSHRSHEDTAHLDVQSVDITCS